MTIDTNISVAVFLAHAVGLENEAADRYAELADSMEAHNNSEAAALFRKMSGFSRQHAGEVEERAKTLELPHLKPWEFQWSEPEGPESAPIERTHYLMTPYHCLLLALHNERRGQKYYADVAALAQDAEVKRLASEFAKEEAEHVTELQEWLARTPQPEPNWDEDLDPPVVGD